MESRFRIRTVIARVARGGRSLLVGSVAAETSKISRVLTFLVPDRRELPAGRKIKKLTKNLDRTRLRLVRRVTRTVGFGWQQHPVASGVRRVVRVEQKLFRVTSRLFRAIAAKAAENIPPEQGGFAQSVRSGKRVIKALARLWRFNIEQRNGLNPTHR